MDDSPAEIAQLAIAAALSSQWDEALALNQKIIETNPKNVDALNRIARANFELGNLENAKKYYQQALDYDPYNQIAEKFLQRIEAFGKKGAKQPNYTGNGHTVNYVTSFIEEPGKTKLVNLLKVAEPQKLSLLFPGSIVNLVVKTRCIAVTSQDNGYLGVLPDDLSRLMIRFIAGGNKYQASIKTVKPNGVAIMIRETLRSAKFRNQPSFLDGLAGVDNSSQNAVYSSDHIIVHDDLEKDSSDDDTEESV